MPELMSWNHLQIKQYNNEQRNKEAKTTILTNYIPSRKLLINKNLKKRVLKL